MSIMGNLLENKMSSDKPMAVVNPMPAVSETAAHQQPEEDQEQSVANVSLQVFQYRQHMGQKKSQVIKWASSKLLLTEELLKQYHIKSEHLNLDSDAAWAERQLALLTDDDENSNEENNSLFHNVLDNEMYRLKKYRTKLHCTIYQVAQEKLKKREKVKLKRLKRRTLISSKKPSNKDKHRY